MKSRLTQGNLLQALRPVQALIAAVHDARMCYRECVHLRPRKLASLSRFLKGMAALPHTTDYAPYEPMLKRRVLKARHRVMGIPRETPGPRYALELELPVIYRQQIGAFEAATSRLLLVLSDVPAHSPGGGQHVLVQTVAQIKAGLSS